MLVLKDLFDILLLRRRIKQFSFCNNFLEDYSMGIGNIKSNPELRYTARTQLMGSWLMPVLVCAIYSLVFTVLNDRYKWYDLLSVNAFGGTYNWAGSYHFSLGWLVTMVIAGPTLLGLSQYFIMFARNDSPPIETLFNGFKNFTPSLVLYLLISIYTFLWTLLLIIPGIIASLWYSQAYYIMNDNPGISAIDAIEQSKEMMSGHEGRLFLLELSFLGWLIISCLTLGLGFIWLNPYYNLTMANFYENLKLSGSYS